MLRLLVVVTVLLLATSSSVGAHRYAHSTFTSSVASIYSLLFDMVVVPNRFGPSRPRGDFIPRYRYKTWRHI